MRAVATARIVLDARHRKKEGRLARALGSLRAVNLPSRWVCLALSFTVAACSGGGSGGTGGGSAGGSSGGGSGGGSGAGGGSGGGSGSCMANTMTDANNCGHCGRVCESGTCSDGACQPVLVINTPDAPTAFLYRALVSGGKVYVWEYTTAPADPHFYLYSAPAPATAITAAPAGTVIQDIGPNPDPNLNISAAAFDSTYLYEAQPGMTTGLVSRKKLDGSEATGTPAALFSLPGMDPGDITSGKPMSMLVWSNIVVDGTAAYLTGTTTANGGAFSGDDDSAIYVISPFPATSATQATKLTGTDGLGYIITDLAVANGHLFWFDNHPDVTLRSLWTVPTTGGTPVKLEDDVSAADHASITSDGTYVYWDLANSQGQVKRCALANLTAGSATVVTGVDSPTEGLVVDDSFVYYATLDELRTAWRVPKAGGTAEALGSAAIPPDVRIDRVIGVDDTYLYFSDLDAKLYRMYKTP
jgi:hypothetical protein